MSNCPEDIHNMSEPVGVSPKQKKSDHEQSDKQRGFSGTLGPIGLPLATLSSLLTMQDVEDHKPKLSKMSWLPDIMVYRASIIPTILRSVSVVTLFSAVVAFVSIWWDKEVGLTNNVVPLLSVVVGLLLGTRPHTSDMQSTPCVASSNRYTNNRGRKDFTSLISNARNLSRMVWIVVTLPQATEKGPPSSRIQLTEDKKRLIRLIVAFVVATKHHLRAEGGVHHADLKGLLPPRLGGASLKHLRTASVPEETPYSDLDLSPDTAEPGMTASSPLPLTDEEAILGLPNTTIRDYGSDPRSPSRASIRSQQTDITHRTPLSGLRSRFPRPLKRRPTAVRVVSPERYSGNYDDYRYQPDSGMIKTAKLRKRHNERTPLIKAGVKPDLRKSIDDGVQPMDIVRRAEVGLGRMVELGMPLIIAHEISRTLFRFRRMGCIETTGPAGHNTMQALVNSMTDQLGSMERIVQTPMPYIIAVHMKQATTMLLFVLPFTLVDALGAKMVPLMTLIAIIYMGIEGIAAQVEQPFGTDPCDLNLDLFCTELLCECEALLERLPEGDEDDHFIFERSSMADDLDAEADDGCE